MNTVCNWNQPTYSDAECNAWQTDCGEHWAITEGKPSENGMKFCHGCGKPLVEHTFQWPADDDESDCDGAQHHRYAGSFGD